LRFSLLLKTQTDVPIFLHHNRLTHTDFPLLRERGAFICRIKKLPLTASTYRITYSLMIGEESYIDYIEHAAELTVIDGNFFGYGETPSPTFGPLLVEAEWMVDEQSDLEQETSQPSSQN
ncbi:MAG: hypothetical protein ABI700_10085, partial [Chloroflexota bacterium]